MNSDALPEEPSDLELEPVEPTDGSDLDFTDMPCTDAGGSDGDESQWEAFIPDEDEWDPEPDSRDFWIENGSKDKESGGQKDKEEDVGDHYLLVSFSPYFLV